MNTGRPDLISSLHVFRGVAFVRKGPKAPVGELFSLDELCWTRNRLFRLLRPKSVALPTVGRIGDVTGDIGGQGLTDFYQFYWSDGQFQAFTSIDGANPNEDCEFELLNSVGT